MRDKLGSANGIRTRVTAVRGRCPRPLDDSAGVLRVNAELPYRTVSAAIFAWSTGLSKQRSLSFPLPSPLDQIRKLREFFEAQRFQKDQVYKFRSANEMLEHPGRLQIVRGVRYCKALGWYSEGGTGGVLN